MIRSSTTASASAALICGDRCDDAGQHFGAGEAERDRHVFDFDLLAGKTDHLVEIRLRVAHRAFAGARDLAQRLVGISNLFRFGDQFQPSKILSAAIVRNSNCWQRDKNRVGHFVQLGRRHDEDDARRRLFHRFQQRVERRLESM